MAKAKKLPSGSWRCQVYSHTEKVDGKDKRIYVSFTSDDPSPSGKREAEFMAAEFAMNKQRKTLSCNLTFGDALDEYIKIRESVLSPATIRKYKRQRKNSIQDLMDIKITKITQEMIQAEINRESVTHSPKTVRDMHGLVSAVFGMYRPDFRLKTTLPKSIRSERYVPTDADIKKLMEGIKGRVIEIPVLLAAFGSMRRGEIAALDAADIDGNVIHVKYTMSQGDDGSWVRKAPKSYAGDRFITYPQFVIDKLPTEGRVTSMTPNKITYRFECALKSNGLPAFRFHDLRHYYASILHALNIPDSYIMQTGGWGNDRVLKDVYRSTLSDVSEKMNNIAVSHFETMQHEMQHGNEKSP